MIAQIVAAGQIGVKRNLPRINVQIKKTVKITNSPIPYFERNGFIKEEVSREELESLYNLGFDKMTEQDLINAKAALNVIGYNPGVKLINMLIENDVLGLARPGIDNHPHLKFIASILPRLRKEAGATHIVLTLPVSLQKLLDVFVLTGEILPNLSPLNLADYGLKGNSDFLELLKVARLAGYKLLAVEPDTEQIAFDPLREQLMARNIQTVLQSVQKSKIIFLAPDRHLCYLTVGDWMPVAGILKAKGYSVCTVNQYWHNDFMPKVFLHLLRQLIEPIALASRDVKVFAALQNKSVSLENALPDSWDITIIYPKVRAARHFKQTILKMAQLLKNNFWIIN